MHFFFRFLIATISFSILPPSKGYIGSKLNIASIRFAYIKVSFDIAMFCDIKKAIIAINMFTSGPANAITIFFMQT